MLRYDSIIITSTTQAKVASDRFIQSCRACLICGPGLGLDSERFILNRSMRTEDSRGQKTA